MDEETDRTAQNFQCSRGKKESQTLTKKIREHKFAVASVESRNPLTKNFNTREKNG